MKIKAAIMGLVIVAFAVSRTSSFAQAKKPNILIIWGDDIGYWNVSAYNQGMMGYKTVVLVIGFIFWVARAQSQLLTGTPTESSTPPKHPTQKTTQTTSPAESTTSTSEAESSAASPKPKRTRKKSTAQASPTPTPTAVPSPTPRKFRFPRLFKPKRSASPTPLGMNSAPPSGSGTAAGADASPAPGASGQRE